jgi:hypothetical protein
MTLNNEDLLPLTLYGTPSGNYDGSSLDFIADPVRAANYYGGQGAIQTATIRTDGFQGNVTIQATLNDQPSIQAAWFEVDTLTSPSPSTAIDGRTITGSFTFMRTVITDFESGSISITLTY